MWCMEEKNNTMPISVKAEKFQWWTLAQALLLWDVSEPQEPGGLCKALSILGHQDTVFDIHHKDRAATVNTDPDI